MSNNHFDLNIENYSKPELEEILELPNNYDISIIETQETKLRQNILNNNISPEIKTKTLDFISKVKIQLIQNIKNTSIQNNTSNINNFTKTYRDVYNLDTEFNSSKTILSNTDGNNIIKQPTTPYVMAMPSEYYQGTINPLNKRILRQNINIDTRFRDNYYNTQSSNFNLDLPLRINKVVSMQLTALELPSTFYIISKLLGNNFFYIEMPGIQPLLISIPEGNYDYLVLQSYINGVIISQTVHDDYKQIQFLVDINSGSINSYGVNGCGRMIVGLTQAGIEQGIQFSLNFKTDYNGHEDTNTPLPLKLGWMLGFRMGYYTNNINYVSESIVEIVGPRYVYLVVDEFTNNTNDSFYSAFTSSILNKNILARISIGSNPFEIYKADNYSLITSPRQYFGPVDIQKLHIQLLDEYGRIIHLNNTDFSFCLTCQTIYDM